jgi:hypothetical protein
MALLVMLFLDLATLPMPAIGNDDDTLYRKALADHGIRHAWSHYSTGQCVEVARNSSDLQPFAAALERAGHQPGAKHGKRMIHFSRVGWVGERAWFELTTSDATSCLLYRRTGASFRLVREIRLPR